MSDRLYLELARLRGLGQERVDGQRSSPQVVLISQLRQIGRPDLASQDFYAGDQHWNAAGHAQAPQAVESWLSKAP